MANRVLRLTVKGLNIERKGLERMNEGQKKSFLSLGVGR